MNFVAYTWLTLLHLVSRYCSIAYSEALSDKLLGQHNRTAIVPANEYGEFQLIQSNVLQIRNLAARLKRDANATEIVAQNATVLPRYNHDREDKKYKHGDKKKKKKKGGGLYSLIKKMKHLPKFLKKMMPMMKGPSMFMMGMMQANLHNFVMHALMMSKMALSSVIMMIIREMVFGDKDQPVKYYNFGYDVPPRRRIITTIEHPIDYKHRRRRNA